MKRTLILALAALMSLSAGAAYAGEGGGGGGGGDRLVDPNSAPPGFYNGVPGYDNQRSTKAYVIQRQASALAARAAGQPSVAQSQTPNLG